MSDTDRQTAGIADLRLQELRCIGDRAPHNAFCDLLAWHGRLWLVYREGSAHVSPDGLLRILYSGDGRKWTQAALIQLRDEDLRDPKLSVTPQDELMLLSASTIRDKHNRLHQLRNLVWFSQDGQRWGECREVGERSIWLWRVTWHRGVAYGIGYACRTPHLQRRFVRLYRSEDGCDYTVLVPELMSEGYPNEHALVFLSDDSAVCLLRCDDNRQTAFLGRAAPPYRDWRWTPLGRTVGGPQMLRLPNGELTVGARVQDETVHTALCRLNLETSMLEEIVSLPSDGDNSYPGMVWQNGQLWMAYYSEHEGNCRVYLARFAAAI